MFNYFNKTDADQYKFYRIPKDLLFDEQFTISFESKILYGILLDRLELSEKNRWEDENGNMYIYFLITNVMECFQCSKNKAMRLMNELHEFGLIEKKPQGLNKPNKIYVKKFVATSEIDEKLEDETLSVFFTEKTANQYCFYKMPKELFSNELFKKISFESKVLYGFLLDRVGLSEQSRWISDDGRVYIYFTTKSTMEYMHCQSEKAVKLMNELYKMGLIDKKRQGFGQPNLIFVNNFIGLIKQKIETEKPEKAEILEVPKSKYWKSQNRNTGGPKIEILEVPKSKSINTEYNKTDIINHSIAQTNDERLNEQTELINIIKESIQYEHLLKYCDEVPNTYLDIVVDVIFNTLNTNRTTTFTIGNKLISYDDMESKLLTLEPEVIEDVIQSILASETDIKFPHKYILTALYNGKENFNFKMIGKLRKVGIIIKE